MLNSKIKEAEDYKNKYKKALKEIKKMKITIQEKDSALGKYKQLEKDVKSLKEQYKICEDIRTD